jgi:regulatory protein
MRITAIKQQVKDHSRYSIFIDDVFSFGISETALIESGITKGQEISEDQIAEFKDSAAVDDAYNKTLGLIARRLRSEWEIRDYLKRKHYDIENINLIIARLYKRNWLNDEAFARMWVENRRLLRSASARRISQELKAKHVSDTIIQKVLEEDSTEDNTILTTLVERKRKQTRYQDDQKLLAYLIRQGYNYQDVKQAIEN